eukprot:TRINITY_DN8443_c0_g1_i8.p2 TRINITY_DN8443_c0_g1~~TRINITY_DN8443_c0_g1_i8.p2  ORF type:complete len:143 (-),score=47.72 TRINITY_DN8443_c0_g1_i8:186-614(-)
MVALDSHAGNASVLEACAGALEQLAAQGEDAKLCLIKSGCVPKAFAAMTAHSKKTNMVVAMVQLMVALLENSAPVLQRQLMSEIAGQERRQACIETVIEKFEDKQRVMLDKIVDKAQTMLSLHDDDDDDNADADVSWIHEKV